MNIADVVKECAMKAYEASLPCDVLFGEVIGASPVKIKVGQMVLEGDIITVAENLLYKEYHLTLGVYEKTIVLEEGIKVGDKLILLRQKGGVRYIALAKV